MPSDISLLTPLDRGNARRIAARVSNAGAAAHATITLPNPRAFTGSIRATAAVFADPASATLLERVRQIAPSDANVVVCGETGTGKELIARQVHQMSSRRAGPFIAVNCGAFSESLVESELFGHEKGAFTGAFVGKPGWFEVANGGSLFLDEIGDLPLSMQVKLLRILQEREVVRVGARKSVAVDVRVIAATNVHLEAAVAAGHFREDLFYRLNVVCLRVPALRERAADILPLGRHFLAEYRARLGYGPERLSPAAEARLLAYNWPGNVRELENVIHHGLLTCRSTTLEAADIQLAGLQGTAAAGAAAGAADTAPEAGGSAPMQCLENVLRAMFNEPCAGLFESIENTVMRVAFEYCHRNQLQAARLLGISRNVLRSRLIRAKEIDALS